MKINLFKTRKTEGTQRLSGFTLLGVFAAVSTSELSASETKTFLIPHSPKVAWFYVDENNDFWIRLIDASWILVPQTELLRTENTLLVSTKFLKQNAPDLVPKSFVDGEVALGSYYQDLGEDEGLNIVANVSGISSITLINTNTLEVLKDNGAQIIIHGRHFNFSDGYLTVNLNFLEKYATDLIPSGKNFPDNVYLGHYDETSPYKLTGKQSVEYNFTDSSTHYKGGGFEIVLDNGKVILVPEYAVISATSGIIQINKNWVIENSQHPEIFWNPDTESYQTAELGASGGSEDTGSFSIWGILGGLGLLGGAAGSLTASSGSSEVIQSVINVYDGPLENALVFIDANENGELDEGELRGRTDEQGDVTFNVDTSNKSIVALTDELTIDRISNEVLAGLKLTAPKGSSVVSPITTLIDQTDLTDAQIKSTFSLPDSFDFLQDNPFDGSFSTVDQTKIISTNSQIVATSSSFASVLKGAGVSEYDAFEASFAAFANVTEEKVIDDPSIKLDLSSVSFIADLNNNLVTKNNHSLEVQNVISAIQTSSMEAIANINYLFSEDSLTSAGDISFVLSMLDDVSEQLASAAESEFSNPGSGENIITFKSLEVLETEVDDLLNEYIANNTTTVSVYAAGPIERASVSTDNNKTISDGYDHATGEWSNQNGARVFEYNIKSDYLVATFDGETIDTASGESLAKSVSGYLIAPPGSLVISPVTSLLAVSELKELDLINALGIPSNFNIIEQNPFDLNLPETDATKIQSINYQILSTAMCISAVTGAGEAGDRQAFETSISSIATIMEDRILETGTQTSSLNLFQDEKFISQIYDLALSSNSLTDDYISASLTIKDEIIKATVNANDLFSFENLNSYSDKKIVLSTIHEVPSQISSALSNELSMPGTGSDLISYDVMENLVARIPIKIIESPAFTYVVFHDLSILEPYNSPTGIDFQKNEAVKFKVYDGAEFSYYYEDPAERSVNFNGNTENIEIEFERGLEISLFNQNSPGDLLYNVVVNRMIDKDGNYHDSMVLETEYPMISIMTNISLGGEIPVITNQQDLDDFFTKYDDSFYEVIPYDVAYGPENDDWLISLDII